MKELRIGMIGYGFMGRTHSNGYNRVSNFFDLEYKPVLKAACARNQESLDAFAKTWGYESTENDWRALIARDDIDAVGEFFERAFVFVAGLQMIVCNMAGRAVSGRLEHTSFEAETGCGN